MPGELLTLEETSASAPAGLPAGAEPQLQTRPLGGLSQEAGWGREGPVQRVNEPVSE